eukprot:5796464-Prymnesium_polylepis.1
MVPFRSGGWAAMTCLRSCAMTLRQMGSSGSCRLVAGARRSVPCGIGGICYDGQRGPPWQHRILSAPNHRNKAAFRPVLGGDGERESEWRHGGVACVMEA